MNTYTSDKHPEKQHNIEFEQQDISLFPEVGYDFGDLSEHTIAVMLVVDGGIMVGLHGSSILCQCRVRCLHCL